MNRVPEAEQTVPVTFAVDPDTRGLIDAYSKVNNISVAEVIRRSLAAHLGVPDKGGVIFYGAEVTTLVMPEPNVTARFVREQRRRGRALVEAKRARQRQQTEGEE